MTIELGFAWLKLPSGREVGIVDVPGHERFVKNMLAGVGGIDLALLIVAANEGVMPQTREHLAILDLIGIKNGIVVITKKDLVDEELLTLVSMEIEELIAATTLSESPIVSVSAMTGEGLDELIAAIDTLLDTTEPRHDLGRPRLPVDRIFTMSGSGTVVTGTLIDGTLSVGQEVEIVPRGLKSRIRGLQTHKSKIDIASPGSRVAANLVGVNTSQLLRGDVITRPGWLNPTRMVTVKLRHISYLQRPLRHGAMVSFHTGAAEVMAKVRLLEGDELSPGDSTWAQLSLVNPLAIIKGDRYIIRSPMETLGGGSVVDAAKAIAALTANPGRLMDYLEVIGKGRPLQNTPIPYIAVPTTAGTGAEVTKNAVLASHSHRVKVSMRSPRMLPLLAVVDPELTLSMPPAVTAATGMDALTQLLEGYVTKRSNPFTDSLCIEGLNRAARSLRLAYQDGDNLNARMDMSLASLFSGLVLANAGLGAVHGIAGPLGGMHPAPHGGVCAKLLPIVMEANVTALQKRDRNSPLLSRHQRLAAILTGSESASIDDGIQWVHHLADELKIPPLSSFGLSTDHIPDLINKSQKASSMKGNPVQLSDSELQQILEKAITQ